MWRQPWVSWRFCAISSFATLKMGTTPKLPLEFWELLGAYIDITHLDENDKTKPWMLKALVQATLLETEFAGISVEKIYCCFCERYRDMLMTTRSMKMQRTLYRRRRLVASER